jgi:spore maturation protein CgeB
MNDGTITGVSNILDNNFARLKNLNLNQVPKKYIKFVLSMHYDSPKTTHHTTFHALWNPSNYMNELQHIHNFKSFDGYLSCYSDSIDSFKHSITNKPIVGVLNHTLSMPMYDVSDTFDNLTCFYAGINWERLNKAHKSFRQNVLQLLKRLEPFKIVSIYGPKLFLDVDVWEGFTSYKCEIPFDGISTINEIKKCGACLVLSSISHIQFGIASNRLFEGLAAGVPIICDDNPFIKKWFGDNVFYVDMNDDNCHKQVVECIEFIKNNKEIVIEKLKQCRVIFLTNFLMHEQLKKILTTIV